VLYNSISVVNGLKIVIANSAGIPIYEQIKEQIRRQIFSGDLPPGEPLPSIRQLAGQLQISVITTMRAYNDLEQEGLVVNVQGKGCYVQAQNNELIREQKLRDIENGLSSAIQAARIAGIDRDTLVRMLDLLMEEDRK